MVSHMAQHAGLNLSSYQYFEIHWAFLCALLWCRHQLPQLDDVSIKMIILRHQDLLVEFETLDQVHGVFAGTWSKAGQAGTSVVPRGWPCGRASSWKGVMFWKWLKKGASRSSIFCQCFFNRLGRFVCGLGWMQISAKTKCKIRHNQCNWRTVW